jgi:Fe2+ transport system protein FeoA
MEARLHQIPPGSVVRFVAFDDAVDPALRERLLAYGLSPAQPLTVLQQAPLTIVVCDHTELAIEAQVARAMRVRSVP